jgi:hypothetical protein
VSRLEHQADDPDGSGVSGARGNLVVVLGTNHLAGAHRADEPLRVVAINDPITFFDPALSFSWELTGRMVLQ